MGQDPTLGWTPAMAAAAMVAAAGAHEGAAVTAAGAAAGGVGVVPRRHVHHTARGRRHKPAAKDEDISSRQGSLRVLGSASVGGATKGVSAELSDAAQPAPAASTAELAAPAGAPEFLGLLPDRELQQQLVQVQQQQQAPGQGQQQQPPAPPTLQQLMQLQQQLGFAKPVTAARSEQQENDALGVAPAAAAAAGGGGLAPVRGVLPPGVVVPGRGGLGGVLAGISSGPAAAEVQGLVDEAPRLSGDRRETTGSTSYKSGAIAMQ